MIRHIVLWKFLEFTKEGSRNQNLITAQSMLLKMGEKIDGIQDIKVGINLVDGTNKSDLVLVILFDDRSALEKYQDHPAHLEVKEFLSNVRYERRIVDYLVNSE